LTVSLVEASLTERLKEPQQDGVSLCIDMYTDDHRKQFYTLQLGGEGLQLPSSWT